MRANVAPRLQGREKVISRVTFAGLACIVISVAAYGAATVPCGIFAFTSDPASQPGSPPFGIKATLNFAFKPATCNAVCTCNKVAYVQVVRILDLTTTTDNFIALSPKSRARMTEDGWWVDWKDGRMLGYYGSENRTKATPIKFDEAYLDTGSNNSLAWLMDTATQLPNTRFEAISVPVCIDTTAACDRRALGYYYWRFSLDGNGKVNGQQHRVGQTWMRDAFDRAVEEWDDDASALGQLDEMRPLP